jgi:putative ABC transport system permease protein
MRDLAIDLRSATRRLRTFSAAAIVLTLGLGIGIVTGFFAIVDAVLLTPIASHGDTVVRIWKQDVERRIARFPLSYPELKMWREQARSFQSIAAISYADTSYVALQMGTEVVPITVSPVSAEFFDVTGSGGPLLGRWFNKGEEHNVTEIAAVASEAFWRRVSGGDPGFVGRRLTWPGGDRAVTIVGVASNQLRYPSGVDLWVALGSFFATSGGITDLNLESRRFANFHFLGRLVPGVSVEQARAELDIINARVVAQYPDDYRLMPVTAEPLLAASLGAGRSLTLFLFAGAALVFFAAGGNVAALLLMRATTQVRDVAVRLALGAGSFRIAREALAESMMLGGASAVLGLGVAQLCLIAAKAVASEQLPRLEFAAIDVRVLAFCTTATLLWVIVVGTLPLWRMRRIDVGTLTTRMTGRATRSTTTLRVMIVAQVTAAVVIATAAGLLVRSLMHLQRIERGFEARNLAVLEVLLPTAHYPEPVDREQFYSRLLPQLDGLPGIESVTTVHLGPGTGQTGLSARMLFEGQPPDARRTNPYGTWEPIMPSYFDTMGIPIVAGRAFTDADDAGAQPVAIVSESVAQRYWPGQDPIGRRLQFTEQFPWCTVVGVAADTRYRELTRDWLTVYFPAKQFFFFSPGAVVARTTGDPASVLADLRQTIQRVEPAAAVRSSRTMNEVLAAETARPRTAVTVAMLFAVIAILVAAVGVYGVFSYDLTHRARELAVRSAVGARPRQMIGMTLRQSLMIGGAGAVLGLGVSSMVTRYLMALLFEVRPLDGGTFAAAGVGLLAIVLLASLLPALRASRVNPASLLRAD